MGFVPGITSNYDQLRMIGHRSEVLLLGLLQVSVLHNIVHLLVGIAGIAFLRTAAGARGFLVIGAAFYLVLWFYGVIVAPAPPIISFP